MSAALIAICGGARADDKKDIEALYAKLSKDIKDNKLDATLALETPDFKSKTLDGRTMTGKEMVEQMKMEGANSKVNKFDIKINKMTVKGKMASVDTLFEVGTTMTDTSGMMGPKGKKHKITGTGAVHNDLAKTKDGWKFKNMEQKSMKMMMDGKPFDPSKMGGGPKK